MTEREIVLKDGAVLRRARPGDEGGILACIRALAEYEREPDSVANSEEALREALFGEHPAVFAHVVEKNAAPAGHEQPVPPADRPQSAPPAGQPHIVGIAVWFLNYSTWTGTHGIWLEDVFVYESERSRGYGRALLAELARLCVERGYARMEWTVLDWNEPSITFYRSLGAEPMSEWTTQRLAGEALYRLGDTRQR